MNCYKFFLVSLAFVILSCQPSKVDQDNAPLVLDMVHHNPGEAPYQSQFNDPEFTKGMGYNGKVYFLFESPALAINWESLDADILPQGSKDREWVDNKAEQIHKMQEDCLAQGMDIYAMSDLVLFPKRLIEKYGIQETFGDPQDSLTIKLLKVQLDEIFDQFPLLDGLVVRIGETYLHDAPYHQGSIKDKRDPQKTIVPLMKLLREEVCEKRNKKVIFRTWYAFDVDSATYQVVNDAVEPHENLIISVKHCEGDFHRGNAFSKIIGQGRHRQIIEVQCAREYEGKGAYPNYIANGVIEGFEEHANMPADEISSLREFTEKRPDLYAGIWTWSRGGGWGGPYIKDELWCELNAWVMAQWASDPKQSEEQIFEEFASTHLNLSGVDIQKFRKLCLLSADAVIRGRNSTYSDMNVWWTRDQGIGWPNPILYPDTLKQQRNLNQKDESVQLWQEIVQLAEDIQWPNDEIKGHVVGSSQYGLHLYEIYRSLLYLADAEARKDTAAMKQWINEYDDAWDRYTQLASKYPQLATLYAKDYVLHIKDPADLKVLSLKNQLNLK